MIQIRIDGAAQAGWQQAVRRRAALGQTSQRIGRVALLAILGLFVTSATTRADDKLNRVTFLDRKGRARTVDGKIVTTAQDGGLLLLGRDGHLWTVTPSQLKQREVTDDDFKPLTAVELGRRLTAELKQAGIRGPFEVVTTKHYVICGSSGRKYMQWCGTLFERLFASFHSHWKRAKGLKLHEPEFPLAAIVLADERQFLEYSAKTSPVQITSGVKGYYNVLSNRTLMYDLTAGSTAGQLRSNEAITRALQASIANVGVIVHEATHQVAFNIGLHTRLADNPMWLLEGMATYFEMPDLRNRVGWRTVGKPNTSRWRSFRRMIAQGRKPDSLTTLISTDDRFRDPMLLHDAYGESWALTFFLIKTKRKAYTEYLAKIAAKPRLSWGKPGERLREFQSAFGDDLDKLDRDFLRYINRLRP